MSYRFIDCQGFGGGMACGATLAGFQLVAKLEKPGGFGLPLMEANRPFLGHGWGAQVGDPAGWEPVETDVVVGTPPCSAFSMMTAGYGAHGVDSRINDCMHDLFGYAARVRPLAVVMESVAGAYTAGLRLMRELTATLSERTGLTYRATHVLQDNHSLGGCTRRKRYFLVASTVPFGVEEPEPDRLPTLGDALADLADLPVAWEDQPYRSDPTWWSAQMRRRPDQLVDGHFTPRSTLSERIMDLAGPGGVAWHPGEILEDVLRRYHEERGDLPSSWAYPSKSRKRPDLAHLTRDKQLAETGFRLGGFNQTRAWDWDQPGRVLTGAGPFMVWHPVGRLITHREAARIMGFPDDWLVAPARDDPRLFLYWGKGTSVHPARWVMAWLRRSLDGRPGSVRGEALDQGDRLVDVSKAWRVVTRRAAVLS